MLCLLDRRDSVIHVPELLVVVDLASETSCEKLPLHMRWLFLTFVSCFAYHDIVDAHFREYKSSCNTLGLFNDLAHWSAVTTATVANMTLAKQTEYADYVTRKMMEEPKEIHLAWIEHDLLTQLSSFDRSRMNVASYGNMAYILLHVSPADPLWVRIAVGYSKLC